MGQIILANQIQGILIEKHDWLANKTEMKGTTCTTAT